MAVSQCRIDISTRRQQRHDAVRLVLGGAVGQHARHEVRHRALKLAKAERLEVSVHHLQRSTGQLGESQLQHPPEGGN